MIDNLGDAISHAREVAEKLTEKAKLMREGSKNGLFYPKDFEDCETCASEHEQLADWLEELAERREADKWISVKERLPEEETDVLVCNEKGDMIVCRGSRSTEIEGEFIWYVCDWRYGEITHWKPLPKPYESEDNK